VKTLILLLSLVSCGKDQDTEKTKACLSRYQKISQCFREYNRTHHPEYVQRVCADKYPGEGCYQ
jgi:hypothetical protein